MSASSKSSVKTELTTNVTPKVPHLEAPQASVTPAIATPETGTLVTVAPASPTAQSNNNDDNSLAALILFVPFIFLIAIVALLLERAIKWGLRRFFSPQPAPKITPTYPQMANQR